MRFAVHIADYRDALVGIEAESAEEAREKGRGLAQMALDRLEHDYDVNAYPYDEYADEIAFEEEDLKG